jgi:hypothetical protein
MSQKANYNSSVIRQNIEYCFVNFDWTILQFILIMIGCTGNFLQQPHGTMNMVVSIKYEMKLKIKRENGVIEDIPQRIYSHTGPPHRYPAWWHISGPNFIWTLKDNFTVISLHCIRDRNYTYYISHNFQYSLDISIVVIIIYARLKTFHFILVTISIIGNN